MSLDNLETVGGLIFNLKPTGSYKNGVAETMNDVMINVTVQPRDEGRERTIAVEVLKRINNYERMKDMIEQLRAAVDELDGDSRQWVVQLDNDAYTLLSELNK